MANNETVAGLYNFPLMANPGTTGEWAYVVPAAGVYPGYPSPVQLAGNDLVLPASTQGVPTVVYTGTASNTAAGGVLNGHPFNVRASGLFYNHVSNAATFQIYLVKAATIAAWTSSSGNVVSASLGTSLCSAAATVTGTGTLNWGIGVQCMYDSTSKVLNAQLHYGQIGGIAATTAGTLAAATSVTLADLNFVITFTLASGTSADKISLVEFVIDQE